jgi:hypothetical protein
MLKINGQIVSEYGAFAASSSRPVFHGPDWKPNPRASRPDVPETMETITANEFAELERLQVKSRRDWPLVFSANCRGDVWAYFTRGYSPEEQREELRGVSRILDRVVKKYRRIRPGLGRFFIDQRGVFYKVEEKTHVQFILFERLS